MSGPLERLGESFAEVKEAEAVFFLLCQGVGNRDKTLRFLPEMRILQHTQNQESDRVFPEGRQIENSGE